MRQTIYTVDKKGTHLASTCSTRQATDISAKQEALDRSDKQRTRNTIVQFFYVGVGAIVRSFGPIARRVGVWPHGTSGSNQMKSATKADLLCKFITSRLEYIKLVIRGSSGNFPAMLLWQCHNNSTGLVPSQSIIRSNRLKLLIHTSCQRTSRKKAG